MNNRKLTDWVLVLTVFSVLFFIVTTTIFLKLEKRVVKIEQAQKQHIEVKHENGPTTP